MTDSEKYLNRMIEASTFVPKSYRAPSAWIGHIPFASWVIKELSPKVFVELGTHTGTSYFTFCQSVGEGDLATKCHAVDTWQGDEHAGHYDDRIFRGVTDYNSDHYATFSQLLRMTFDDATNYFSDHSVDLLHIDGLHTYEAVRNDFDKWLPKMTSGGLIIFHDTNVRERDFGVWKLLEELRNCYPCNLEFTHSYGLGVVQIDRSEDSGLDWLKPGSAEQKQVLSFFSSLGSKEIERYNLFEAASEDQRRIAVLNQAAAERDRRILELNRAAEEREAHTRSQNEIMGSLSEQNKSLSAMVESAKNWQKQGWIKRAFHRWKPRV